MILPCAVATMSIQPNVAHNPAAVKAAKIVQRSARPIGDGGICWISNTAGRNSMACLLVSPDRPCRRDSACHAVFHTVQCLPNAPKTIRETSIPYLPDIPAIAYRIRRDEGVHHATPLRQSLLYRQQRCDAQAEPYSVDAQ